MKRIYKRVLDCFIMLALMLLFVQTRSFAVSANENFNSQVEIGEEGVEISDVNFPDKEFREIIIEEDTDKDGYLSKSEISGIRTLVITHSTINNVKGIEYLTNLTDFGCLWTQVTKIDLSNNKALVNIECQDNSNLKELILGEKPNLLMLYCTNAQLSSIDVSKCPSMYFMTCENNQLASLDVSNNKALFNLNCGNNQLTALDVSCLNELSILACSGNMLSALDVSNNKSLTKLSCMDNYLSVLDVSNNSKIEGLYCSRNNFSEVDVSHLDRFIDIDYYAYIGDDGILHVSPRNGSQPVLNTPSVSYRTYVQKEGWQSYVNDGAFSGTKGKGYRLEGVQIKLNNSSGSIKYRTYVQKKGWVDWSSNNGFNGTKGMGYRLEAIQIKLAGAIVDNYDVYYRVYAQKFGWLGWAKNGKSAGTAGYGYRLEGINIKLVKRGDKTPSVTKVAYRKKG